MRRTRHHGLLTERDADALLTMCDAYDDENATVAGPTDDPRGSTRTSSTLKQWIEAIATFGGNAETPILDADADTLN